MSHPTADGPSSHTSPQTGRQEIDFLYTPLVEALRELQERRKNPHLRALVGAFHSSRPLMFLSSEPFAVLSRPIISPTYELGHFFTTTRSIGMRPLCLEFTHDKFVARNRDKFRLCHLAFDIGAKEFRGLRVADLDKLEGLPACQLNSLKTRNGWTLVRWHHALLEHAIPGASQHVADFS